MTANYKSNSQPISQITPELLQKYDVPAPRYTSYPTVPYWSDNPTTDQWIEHLSQSFRQKSVPNSTAWSLYLHIPFCETLCTYCGCNTIITKDHGKSTPYIDLLSQEFETYLSRVPSLTENPLLEMHLGGGTPTFLEPTHLKALIENLFRKVKKAQEFEASIEIDPRHTSLDQLELLAQLGFRRVSLGVQDFNAEVQRLVHRHQPFEMTKKTTEDARRVGFTSVNFDLIYGLPKQSLDFMKHTIEQTLILRPDRIALYSLAVVPWIKPAQRLFKDEDLPGPDEKRALYEYSRDQLTQAGYIEIGMDHFALPSDSLAKSQKQGSLHRNFMGYAARRTEVLLGIGVSSISEAPTCFHQNEKVFNLYEKKVSDGQIPTLRGHLLSEDDLLHREEILTLMTQYQLLIKDPSRLQDLKSFLSAATNDGLVVFNDSQLLITEKGKPFLRNICMAFDARLRLQKPDARIFSQAI